MDQSITQSSSQQTQKAVLVIAFAVVLGLLFNYLFYDKSIGISIFIFASLVTGILFWVGYRYAQAPRRVLWFLVPILFFSAMPAIRANEFLIFLNVVAVLSLLLLMVREIYRDQITSFGVTDYITTAAFLPIRFLQSSFKSLSLLSNQSKSISSSRWSAVIKGILMALPVLFLFGVLFASADLAFRQFLDSIISFDISPSFVAQAVLFVIVFIAASGLFAYVALGTNLLQRKPENAGSITTGREVETAVFLSLIAALFLTFIVFQLTYLFGGAVNITARGFTYAEYARRGFWELLVVALLTLLILLSADTYTRRTSSRKLWFTLPGMVIVFEVLVIIFAAWKRLTLYLDAYGMTDARFYGAVFIMFLALLFVLLGTKIFLEKKNSFFMFGALLSAIAFLIGINIANPDAFIAKTNQIRFEETGKIDAYYLGVLSTDAVPSVLAGYDRLSAEDKETLKMLMESKLENLEKDREHWQSYNASRVKALRMIQEKF